MLSLMSMERDIQQKKSKPKIYRLRELDFLRGIAIILVLFRHKFLFRATYLMGWTGVDLFFVLSGFLVSGLLFKEYEKYGNIQSARFLIRRGYKIYPIYYLTYPLYLVPLLTEQKLSLRGLIGDLTFMQNYVSGWGYAYVPSWSLAIEEHFYFGLTFLVWLSLKKRVLKLKTDPANKRLGRIETGIMLTMVFCLVCRIIENIIFPGKLGRNWTMTHLRIDSLLAGVLISYLYHFRSLLLQKLYDKWKPLLLAVAFAGLIWTPFIDPVPSVFAKTVGFSLLYISFGIILIYFLLEKEINRKLNLVFSAPVVNIIARIGYCSYSIYVIHSLVNTLVENTIAKLSVSISYYVLFFLTSILSIVIGMLMTYTIESFFLKVRDKYFPRRSGNPV